MARIGINGFGRIGRYLVRLMAERNEFPVVINARADNASLAHLFKYDSVHHTFKGTVGHDENGIIINGTHIAVTRCKPNEWQWKDYGVELVVESTGTIKKRAGLAEHMACGAKKVIMSAPVSDADITIVMGVNDGLYDPAKHDVVSSASCTTNCLAPVAKVLNDTFGIEHGLMTTIHSYTMSQRILDGSQKDIRRARAAAMSMIPTTTGAAKAVALVLPELKGKLDGIAIRVPTPNVSIVDLNCVMKRDVTVDEVNAALTAAANDNFGVSDEPLVSIDYNGDTHGGVVDLLSTSVMSGNMLKVLIWYDNEAGFTNQLLRLITMVAGKRYVEKRLEGAGRTFYRKSSPPPPNLPHPSQRFLTLSNPCSQMVRGWPSGEASNEFLFGEKLLMPSERKEGHA